MITPLFHYTLNSNHREKETFLFVIAVQSPSRVQLFKIPWTAACQASLSLMMSWWRGLPNPMKQGHSRWTIHSEEFWQNVIHWRRKWQTTPVYLPWETHELYKKAYIYIYILATAAAKSLQSCPTLCHRRQPTRLPCPWDSPGNSFSNAWKWKVKVKSLRRVRLFTTPWTAAYQAPPHGIFQARVLEWGAVALLGCAKAQCDTLYICRQQLAPRYFYSHVFGAKNLSPIEKQPGYLSWTLRKYIFLLIIWPRDWMWRVNINFFFFCYWFRKKKDFFPLWTEYL